MINASLQRTQVASWWLSLAGVAEKRAELLLVLIGGPLTGLLAWGNSSSPWTLLLLLLMPFAWGATKSRSAAFLMMLGYYAAASRALPGGAAVFFGDSSSWAMGWSCWLCASLVLAMPYLIFWSPDHNRKCYGFVSATVITALPPLGVIGWESPLSEAGMLFPSLKWLGLMMTLALIATIISRRWRLVLPLLTLALLSNLVLAGPHDVPQGWSGVNTQFARLSSAGFDDSGQINSSMGRVSWINEFARTIPANSVKILPETLLGRYGGLTALDLQAVETELADRSSRLVVGAELTNDGSSYKNVVVVLGAGEHDDKFAVQGIPVPISMWAPWKNNSAQAHIFGHDNVIGILGIRAAVLICYEQLLPFPLLWSETQRPRVLLAVSNVWWASGTSIPNIQHQTMASFGRLFGSPVIFSKNS